MRKAIIAVIAFLFVGIGFWIYIEVMDSVPIVAPRADDTPDITVTESTSTPQKIGTTTPEEVVQMRYFKYDPETNEPIAEYGFERMLNPGQGRTRWEVKKPYIIFYRPGYRCRIDSERGIFQMDSVGSSSSASVPKDAQLDENVIIHITPAPDSPMGETYLYMDDLLFSSERSEFSTDGPVRLESPQVKMAGYGLILIFNTALGKIEYLNLRDLGYLQLKDFASARTSSQSKDIAAKPNTSRQTSPQTDHVPSDPATVRRPDYYLCTIDHNVEIQYANELVVYGAEQVNIQNINFAGIDQKTSASNGETKKSPGNQAAIRNEGQVEKKVSEDSWDVIVKCDGGIVIQPMPDEETSGQAETTADLALEMSGAPLRIDRIFPTMATESETLAHCGLLKYKPAEDVLRLYTSVLQPEILLNAQESNSHIRTSGNVFWDRKAKQANIFGPGKVTIGNLKHPTAEPSEIKFLGEMDLRFSGLPEDMSSATIQTINLTGGMDAILRQNGILKTKSDSAVLEFGQENMISQARLNGDVYFESLDKDTSSTAASESAVFYFTDNQIARADLKGDVNFASGDGQFTSSDVQIDFQSDDNGTVHPKMLRTSGQAVMQTVSSTTQPPAKFEAKKIEYDMETGVGIATGPIRVTYYQKADAQSGSLEPWIPLTITADDHAKFFADQDHAIKQVIFKEDVTADRLLTTNLFTQRDQVHGEMITVDLDKDALGQTAVKNIIVTEGDVFIQSKKVQGSKTLFNVRLDCQRIDCSGPGDIVVATGPGKIALDNSKAIPDASVSTGMNFKRPCYALIEGFDTLQWNMMDQTIIADGQDETMQMAYIPLKDNQQEKYIYINSRQIQASFLSNTNGNLELKRIFTDKGVVFEQRDQTNTMTQNYLMGQTLEYDVFSDVGWLTITGSEASPCFLNGNRVPQIRYNVNTGQLDTTISSTPGLILN